MLLTCALLEGSMDILLLVGLIALNGIFAMSEIALVAAKSGRLKMMAEDNAPAALALELKTTLPSFFRLSKSALLPSVYSVAFLVKRRCPFLLNTDSLPKG